MPLDARPSGPSPETGPVERSPSPQVQQRVALELTRLGVLEKPLSQVPACDARQLLLKIYQNYYHEMEFC